MRKKKKEGKRWFYNFLGKLGDIFQFGAFLSYSMWVFFFSFFLMRWLAVGSFFIFSITWYDPLNSHKYTPDKSKNVLNKWYQGVNLGLMPLIQFRVG